MKKLLLLLLPLALGACAPRAILFHETTKVAFAATYNTADPSPISSSFGYKRRIVAAVPAQERVSVDGSRRHDVNNGEALSLVSKFHVRVGTFREGVVITNNFASGMAARVMTASAGSASSINALMHNQPIEVSPTTGETSEGKPAAQAVRERIRSVIVRQDTFPTATTRIKKQNGTFGVKPVEPPLPATPPPAPTDAPAGSTIKWDPATKKWIVVPIAPTN